MLSDSRIRKQPVKGAMHAGWHMPVTVWFGSAKENPATGNFYNLQSFGDWGSAPERFEEVYYVLVYRVYSVYSFSDSFIIFKIF